MLLSYLRSWLPIAPNVTVLNLEHIGYGNLTHNSHKCTSSLLFALSNIIGSDPEITESIISKTDIYRALVLMYKLLPTSCKE